MKIKNKRGAEKIISVYWFAILFIVAGAIVYMVSVFYGEPYDVREVESDIIAGKIAVCLSENNLDEDLKNNFLEVCHFNFNTDNPDGQYYIEVSFSDFNTGDKAGDEISAGNINLKDNPNIGKKSLYSKNFYVVKNDQELIADIQVITNKENENINK